jgi:hypothetical protein
MQSVIDHVIGIGAIVNKKRTGYHRRLNVPFEGTGERFGILPAEDRKHLRKEAPTP